LGFLEVLKNNFFFPFPFPRLEKTSPPPPPPTGWIFYESVFEYFSNFVEKIQVSLKSDQNNEYFA